MNRDSPSNRSYREDREETSQISATIGREEDESREIHLELKRRKWQRAGAASGIFTPSSTPPVTAPSSASRSVAPSSWPIHAEPPAAPPPSRPFSPFSAPVAAAPHQPPRRRLRAAPAATLLRVLAPVDPAPPLGVPPAPAVCPPRRRRCGGAGRRAAPSSSLSALSLARVQPGRRSPAAHQAGARRPASTGSRPSPSALRVSESEHGFASRGARRATANHSLLRRHRAGLVDADYWRGTPRPRPVLDWYLKRVDEVVPEARDICAPGCLADLRASYPSRNWRCYQR
ncbi:actin cytoskeleton-regulatory complex protein PAN1-like [Panicum hallii]|uniref:actin cytoskeleton-regulatory complex protein PAN1-like n=1 Tax=Panicum hallii TaxID=206008 RepID=UPI000DF4D1F7|nr:actin cytoskeleton-regulatory complex protein PAN1-like [Panicum hallii]